MFFTPFEQKTEKSNDLPVKHVTGFKLGEDPNSDKHLNQEQRNIVKAYKLAEGMWVIFVKDELISFANDQQSALEKCVDHFNKTNQKPEQMTCVCIGKWLAEESSNSNSITIQK